MKPVGSIRQVDQLGRLVIPADIRKALNISEGNDFVEFFIDDDNSIVIKKYKSSCVFCHAEEGLISYKDQSVCSSCLNAIKKM